MCVLIFAIKLSKNFLSYKEFSEISHMYKGIRGKHPLFLLDTNDTWIFSRLSKSAQISNVTKIRPVGADLSHADSQTDTTKLMVAFRNFSTAPKRKHDVIDNVLFSVLRWKSSEWVRSNRKCYSYYQDHISQSQSTAQNV